MCLKVRVNHPHRYLLFYLRSLCHWIGDNDINNKLSLTCWALLNDYYVDPRIINHKANHIAIAVIELSLQLNHFQVPFNDEAVITWNQVFDETCTKEIMAQIIKEIMDVYEDQEQIVVKRDSDSNARRDAEKSTRSYMPQQVFDYQRLENSS